MILAEFSLHHPIAYRRLLGVACAVVLASGLVSMASHNRAIAQRLTLSSLTMALPAAQITPTAQTPTAPHLTELPGADGTATPVSSVAAAAQSAGNDIVDLGEIMNDAQFGSGQWGALNELWARESHWNPAARNSRSGACGIPQALPCSKITNMSPTGQIAWGLSYIAARYGTPSSAWSHELRYGWY